MTVDIKTPIHMIDSNSSLSRALIYLIEHRFWSESTIESYQYDVKLFEKYLIEKGYEPTLESGQHLSLVTKWIAEQTETHTAYKTILRRVAVLSSLYGFYKELGITHTNVFKAIRVPGEHSNSLSRTLGFEDLKKVYGAIEYLKTREVHLEIPSKLLLFTGLRNHAITRLTVNNIVWDKELIVYNEPVKNSKNKYQLLPLPPIFFCELRKYVENMELKAEDPLCYGLKGYPLKNKQLNVLVNRINDYLNWNGESRVTPHGFRYSIATLLDERGLPLDTIKYLLGHSSKETVQIYLKSNARKIMQIRTELTKVEYELEQSLSRNREEKAQFIPAESKDMNLPYSEEFLLQLSLNNPKLLEQVMMNHYKQ
ncbi:tyrosine-type recombinase/integrase [Peribacillus deserti]|uniref:Integrase n=1 Tax=Peribacillus deserti TaxID=673318 RepID=A0A2N5M1L9_9BACI|nr:site-specific integrase [Peribacillus deserti]PLT28205.1 hypothetical protein CUU66_19880 [Peribacillus deserti]